MMISWILQSCLLIIGLILLRWMFHNKISSLLQYACWGVVAIRLLLPFSPLEIPWIAPSPVNGISNQLNQQDFFFQQDDNTISPQPSDEMEPEGIPDTPVYPLSAKRLFVVIWTIGSAAAMIWFLGSGILFSLRLKQSRKEIPMADYRLPAYLAENIASPCLYGIFRPAVYLTPQAANSNTLPHILAHELCHYRHGDAVWNWIRCLCLAVWWWNPLVWAAAYLSKKDSELACDEAVLKSSSHEYRMAYGRSLIETASGYRYHFSYAVPMASPKKELSERLHRITQEHPHPVFPAISVLLLGIALTGCMFSTAKPSSGGSGQAEKLLEYQTPYTGDNAKVGGIITQLDFPDGLSYDGFSLQTKNPPYGITVNLKVSSETRIQYEESAGDARLSKNALIMMALVENAEQISFSLEDEAAVSTEITYVKTWADTAAGGNIHQFAESAEALQSLLDMPLDQNGMVIFEISQIGEDGQTKASLLPATGSDAELAGDIIMDYMLKSAAWPGKQSDHLKNCYLIRAVYLDGTVSDYCAYLVDGKPVLERRKEGYYSIISDQLYQQLADRFHSQDPRFISPPFPSLPDKS